jgi:hypothetical protein
METNITYYIALLVLIIIGFVVVKKVASCLVKSIFTIVLLAIAIAIYYFYLR